MAVPNAATGFSSVSVLGTLGSRIAGQGEQKPRNRDRKMDRGVNPHASRHPKCSTSAAESGQQTVLAKPPNRVSDVMARRAFGP